MKIRSLLFFIIFIQWGLLVGITLMPLLISKKSSLWTIKLWAKGVQFISKFILKINLEINGKKNISDKPCIIAAQHQSSFETYILFLLFKNPIFIVKESLHTIPIAGWFIKRCGAIGINRNKGLKSLKKILCSSEQALKNNEILIIFPEGTRKIPNNDFIIQSGISAIYNHCKVPVIPLSLNSGFLWGKNSFFKKSGTITFDFAEPILPGLNRKNFEKELKEKIQNKSLKLFKKFKE
tara:strand:+ start:209 stop:919 length:711 start_codon:yes stop_codon:yes gene_type:complete